MAWLVVGPVNRFGYDRLAEILLELRKAN